jgi:hypothetical protein
MTWRPLLCLLVYTTVPADRMIDLKRNLKNSCDHHPTCGKNSMKPRKFARRVLGAGSWRATCSLNGKTIQDYYGFRVLVSHSEVGCTRF